MKTLVAAVAGCLFITGCYVAQPLAQDNPHADGGFYYYYLKFDVYSDPGTGDGRLRDDFKLWDDFEGVVSDENPMQTRMALRAHRDVAGIFAE
ncbi:MAG TPA: hypothetical protein VGH16_14850 [Candidatus Binatia bacterium]|jgi:hypothetical protein